MENYIYYISPCTAIAIVTLVARLLQAVSLLNFPRSFANFQLGFNMKFNKE